MIRSFRAFFLGRAQRERVMLVIFALMLVGYAFSHFSDQVKRFWGESHHTSVELALQAQDLAARNDIMISAQKAAGQFDPARTLNAASLLATVTQLATDAGMVNVSGVPDQQEGASSGQFAVHTLHFTIPKTDWPSLLNFYVALRKLHPYIGIEQFNIGSSAGASAVNVDMRLSSVEIVRGM